MKSLRLRDRFGRFRKKGSKGKTPKSKTPKAKTPKAKTPKSKTPKANNKTPRRKSKSKPKQPKSPKSIAEMSTFSIASPNKPIVYGHVFSNSCGHCVDMQPDWDKLVKKIDKDIELFDIGKDHSQRVRQFNDRFDSTLNFDGFPTIFKLNGQSQPVEYYDDYYKREQQKFENKQRATPVPPLRSEEGMRVWLLGG